MRVSKTYSAQIVGMHADIVTIEVDLSNGLHSFSIVGLGDKAVGESKDRMSAAIKNSGFVSPKQKNQKVVISLAPADMRKEGTMFDVGMAVAYLAASGEIAFEPEKKIFIGELSLEGNIRRVSGILAMIQTAKSAGFSDIFVPWENAKEAGLIADVDIYPARSLREVIRHIMGENNIQRQPPTVIPRDKEYTATTEADFAFIFGQESAKRALEIAAAGRHNIAMYGPPGTGKTMLAKAFSSILPALSNDETLEVTQIHSIAKTLEDGVITMPPFRAPHHTSSYASLVGGGNGLRPGEITLAHKGVLFLDEFPEFDKRVIDALRQPLEDQTITVARAKGSVTYPAQCIMIAAMNPCPCGYAGMENNDAKAGDAAVKKCLCTNNELLRYRKKISGPIVDRIDLWTKLSKVEYGKFLISKSHSNVHILNDKKIETSSIIRKRIIEACEFHRENGENQELSAEAEKILISSAKKLGFSGRAYQRTIKVARTIANLDRSKKIQKGHILEALQYRQRGF